MSIIDTITVTDFKTQFPRFTPVYLPLWLETKTYFKGDIVYYSVTQLFYQCNVDSTTELPTDAIDWQLYNSNVLFYTQDSDITNAMNEAKVNFNEGLFANDDSLKMTFLYLTAYYLTIDFQNSTGASVGVVQSKSVGSVSESYAIPQWVMNNPLLSLYTKNGYGQKYLTLILPLITGNIILAKGATTLD